MYIPLIPEGYETVYSLRKGDSAESRIFLSALESETLAELCVAARCTGGQCVCVCVFVSVSVCVCVCVKEILPIHHRVITWNAAAKYASCKKGTQQIYI